MELLKFEDYCIIRRESGEYDEWDNPINARIVHEGSCSYQAGGQTSLSIVSRNDVVYLPTNEVSIDENDVITVTTLQGRVRNGIVNKVRDIKLPLSEELYTKIEIKYSKGD